jgi:thiamine transport system ATP-binding protein
MTLSVDAMHVRYPDFVATYTATVPRGALCAIVGPSGGGKTTFLHALAGFEPVVSGRVAFDGADLTAFPPADRPIAMLFQDHNLFAHLSARANVGLGVRPSLRLDATETARVDAALRDVELLGEAGRLAAELSGGQQQRVALARALVMARPLLLLDEPFGALDPGLRKGMVRLVDRLRRALGLTVLMTIHTPDDIRAVADQVLFVVDGRVAASGPPDAVLRPDLSPAMRIFLG